jgi:hypothetical protein
VFHSSIPFDLRRMAAGNYLTCCKNSGPNTEFRSLANFHNAWEFICRNSPVVSPTLMSDFPLTLPLPPESGGEGGVRGDFHATFYATFRLSAVRPAPCAARRCKPISRSSPLSSR